MTKQAKRVSEEPLKAAAGIWSDQSEEPVTFERRLRRESEARVKRELRESR